LAEDLLNIFLTETGQTWDTYGSSDGLVLCRGSGLKNEIPKSGGHTSLGATSPMKTATDIKNVVAF
jgi:hypothetical protein